MGAGAYFTLAVLVVMLMPTIVLSMEGRKMPDWLYPVIAGCGLVSRGLHGGLAAVGWSVVAALIVLVLIGVAITLLRSATRLRILTGGQIKLMAAGATWLGPVGAVVMIVVATLVLFTIAALRRTREVPRRPDSAIIVAVAILGVALQQQAMTM